MTSKATRAIVCGLLGCALTLGQALAQNQSRDDTVAPDIPGVVAGGTTVQFIKDGFAGYRGSDCPPGRRFRVHRDAGQPDHENRRQRKHLDISREHEPIERPGVRWGKDA